MRGLATALKASHCLPGRSISVRSTGAPLTSTTTTSLVNFRGPVESVPDSAAAAMTPAATLTTLLGPLVLRSVAPLLLLLPWDRSADCAADTAAGRSQGLLMLALKTVSRLRGLAISPTLTAMVDVLPVPEGILLVAGLYIGVFVVV